MKRYRCFMHLFACYPWACAHTDTHTNTLCAQLCLTLCDPTECSPPGSTVYRIFPARILERAAISFSSGLPNPGIKPLSPASLVLADGFFATEPPRNPHPWAGAMLIFVSSRFSTCANAKSTWKLKEPTPAWVTPMSSPPASPMVSAPPDWSQPEFLCRIIWLPCTDVGRNNSCFHNSPSTHGNKRQSPLRS